MSDTRKLLDYWLPPSGAGEPFGCVATSFTFEPEFFEGECLARFLTLDTTRDLEHPELELQFLLEQEVRLAESRACVVVDRSYQAQGRSLRWDILTVGLRGGVQHAKVSLLVWEHAFRVVLGSANLTAAAYRRNVETAIAFDVGQASTTADPVVAELLEALDNLVRRAAGRSDEDGPMRRALETVGQASARLGAPSGTARRRRDPVRAAAAVARPGKPVLTELERVWSGGTRPSRATVMSPFFDAEDGVEPCLASLRAALRQRGSTRTTFVVPVDEAQGQSIIRAPENLRRRSTTTATVDVRRYAPPEDEETRRLHAKVVLLESDEWIAALVGSSNFTRAGLGLFAGAGNLEIGVAIGAPAGSSMAAALRALVPVGDVVQSDDVAWEPEQDDDTPRVAVLPFGFLECLLDPADRSIMVRLRPSELPMGEWSITTPHPRRVLVDRRGWVRQRRWSERRIPLVAGENPLYLRVEWADDGVDWPLNVTEPALLPPVEVLRELPASALIAVLATTRPLHESLASWVVRAESGSADVNLDPLIRHNSSSHLFKRTKRVAAALEGLRIRLERPAGSLDVVEWRLRGPLGARALADGLIREKTSALQGETAFLIAELALSLSRVDWSLTARYLELEDVLAIVRAELRHLGRLARSELVVDGPLTRYVKRALKEARV